MIEATNTTERMGHQKLPGKLWAKAEIMLGNGATVIGSLSAVYYVFRMAVNDEAVMLQAGMGAAAAILGMYLSSAGNRSMLYRSQNAQTEYLERILSEKK